MKRFKRVGAVVLLGLLAGVSSGCLAVAAAAGAGAGVAYVKGNTEGLVRAEPPAVLDAARAVFEEMDIIVTSSESGEVEAELKGRTATDKDVKVDAERQGEGLSKVWVRV
ncbi:MAG TPA: DUF3568 family protein, partial [Phycisphaeraceae bacterium]